MSESADPRWTFSFPDGIGERLMDEWKRFTAHPGGIDVPIAPPNPVVAGKLLFDEMYRLGRAQWPSRALADVDVATSESAIAAALELYGRNGWLDDPTTFHTEPTPASPRFAREWSPSGSFDHAEFVSGYAPRDEDPGRATWLAQRANRTAHAWMLRNAADTTRWLVCVPGLGMGTATLDLSVFDAARLHAEHGLNVAVYVPPLHGPRRRGWWSAEGVLDGSPLAFVHACAQAVWDLRRLLGWIRSQGGSRIGVYGLSTGATTAALLAGVDAGLACVVAGIPVVDVVSPFDSYAARVARATGEREELVRARTRLLLRLASPLAMHPLVPRSRRYVFGGIVDRMVAPESVAALAKHWERPHTTWYPGGHTSFPTEPRVQRALERAWQQAGLAVPSPASAHAGPRSS